MKSAAQKRQEVERKKIKRDEVYADRARTIKATHIIIGGIVFPWEAKAPYVASGKSTLGALEYNKEHDVVKCHICGGWFKHLGIHADKNEGVSAREYKATYGLKSKTSLAVPSIRKHRKRQWKRQVVSGRVHILSVSDRVTIGANRRASCPEERNLKSLCQAQIRCRISNLAKQLGSTPTARQLRELDGLNHQSVTSSLGMPLNKVMESLGLAPNRHGFQVGHTGYIKEASL